ncbi:MAG: hypothetical protein LC641_09495 [Spirochaeta sp.]|nr:hypothetical protein [Spirochaeta sp.]
MQIQVWAPANVLLVGEYIVTEEGGLGIAAAVEPELHVRVSAAPEFQAEAYAGTPLFHWLAHEAPPPHAEVVDACLSGIGYGKDPPLHIKIDSSAFYTVDGNKRGLGSSAAVAAALTTALFLFELPNRAHEAEPLHAGKDGCFADLAQQTRHAILRSAVHAHRAAQGGGSAYDVTASLYGGLGVFHGGDLPGWDPLPADALPPAMIRYGKAPVSSPAAVIGYKGLKAVKPEYVKQQMTRSNEETRRLASALRAHNLHDFRSGIQRMAGLGLELGELIGVSAQIEPIAGGYGKAVGAGNEIAVVFSDSAKPAATDQPLHITLQGVRWCITE